MLNKNDPLISAVQQVMKNNEIEREVTRLVNEAFGVQDRKALPHERQAEWNHVYQLALSEAKIDHPNKQVLDVHEPEKDELTPEDFAELRRRRAAKMAKKKPVAEEMKDPNERDVTSPSSAGMKAPNYAKGTPDYAKPTEMKVNRGEKTSLPPGTLKKHMKEENLEEKKSEKWHEKQKEIADSIKKKNPKISDEKKYAFAGAAANKAMSEGWGDQPGSPLDRIKGAISSWFSGGGSAPKTNRTNTVNAGAQTSGPNRGLANGQNVKVNPNTQTAGPNRGLSQTSPAQSAPPAAPAAPAASKAAAPVPKAKPQKSAKVVPTASKPTSTKGMNDKDFYNTMKKKAATGKKFGDIMSGKDKLRYLSLRNRRDKGEIFEGVKQLVAQKMEEAAMNISSASDARQNRVVADPKKSFIGSARAEKERKRAAGEDNTASLPGPDRQKAERQASLADKAKDINANARAGGRPQTVTPGALPPVSKNMSGGGSDYRKAQSSTIKVSDTEVMNDPKFKQARKSVGGEAGARKIQVGQNVKGLGRFNQGDTIMSRVRTDIAARKNVGRES